MGSVLCLATAPTIALSVRMLAAVRRLASGAGPDQAPAGRTVVRIPFRAGTVEGLVYRPAGPPPGRAIVLAAGVSRLGCYHPRLAALARSLADTGFVVITPDISMFRRFEVSPAALDELAAWVDAAPSVVGRGAVRRVGLVGISFSGTLAILAAARPELRDRIAFVLSVGAYDDLARVTHGWFAGEPRAARDGYPTRCYGKWIVMLAAASILEPPRDRALVVASLHTLLDTERAPPPPPGLGPEGQRWHRLAVAREGGADDDLSARIEAALTPYFAALSPPPAAPAPGCPVFLAHGAYDDLIPPDESRRLSERLGGAPLLITPLLTHTHPLAQPLALWARLAAGARLVPFFYRLAAAAR